MFVQLAEHTINQLRAKNWQFYTFIGAGGVRFMWSWGTTKERIDELVADIKASL